MHCLKCWDEIREKTAVYTKSCKHVFCEKCSAEAFKKELSCPLCDTVLPKDGIGTVTLMPDASDIKKASSRSFGFEPDQLCNVLKLGLDFWARQKNNESLQHLHELKGMQKRMVEFKAQNAKLSKALDEERLKKISLQNEKDGLQSTITELETRYAQKSRSLRKLSELYNELRQVHKRLEKDLRGVADANEYEDGINAGSEFEIHTQARSANMMAKGRSASEQLQRRREANSIDGRSGLMDGDETNRDIKEFNENRINEGDAVRTCHTNEYESVREGFFNLVPNAPSRMTLKTQAARKRVAVRGIRRRRYSTDSNPDVSDRNGGYGQRVSKGEHE